jgi:hypothetical protein
MESGNRKTAVFNRLLAPLAEWEQREIARMEPARRKVESQQRITEGFHTKMEVLQRQAYGFRNFQNYRLRVRVMCS